MRGVTTEMAWFSVRTGALRLVLAAVALAIGVPATAAAQIHTGRIASRGLVLYGPDDKLAYEGAQGASPRWAAHAIESSGEIRQGQVLPPGDGGLTLEQAKAQNAIVISVVEFNDWVRARLAVEDPDSTLTVSADDFEASAESTGSSSIVPKCMKDGTLTAAGSAVPLLADTQTVVVRKIPNPTACADLVVLQSPLSSVYRDQGALIEEYEREDRPDGFTTLLLDLENGQWIARSKHLIARETGYMTFSEDETQALPSGCKIESAPFASPRQQEVDAWRFINCKPPSMRVAMDCPPGFTPTTGDGKCSLLRAWAPITGASVEFANYGAFRYGSTDDQGYFVIPYRVLPDALFNFNVYATMRFENFNPRLSSSRMFYVTARAAAQGAWSDSAGTPATFTNFPIDAAMLTMKATVSNAGTAEGAASVVPMVDPTYQVAQFFSQEQEPGTGDGDDPPAGGEAPSELTTQYDPNPLEEGAPPNPLRHIGLLKQISAADLRDTDIYVFRLSDGRLIGSRWGLLHQELELPQPEPILAKVHFSALFRGPITRYLGQAASNINPAASTPHVYNDDQTIRQAGKFGIELDYDENSIDGRSSFLYDGDQVKVIVVNRATGYIGTRLAEMKIGANGMPQFKAIPAPNASGDSVVMRPPNLRIRATRRPAAIDPETDPEVDYVIGFEGSGLSDDQLITIETEWLDHDGSPLPEELPGFTGRLAKIVAPESGAESIPITPRAGAGGAGVAGAAGAGAAGAVALRPVGDAHDGDPEDGDGSADQVGLFKVEPGRRTTVIRLPQNADVAHYYVHVDGAPKERNVDFTGRRKPEGSNFSINQVCYSNCGLTPIDPANPNAPRREDCYWDCFLKENGAGPAQLGQRPASFVPFQVPIFDVEATRSVIETRAAALKEAIARNEGGYKPSDPWSNANAPTLPGISEVAIHRWVYRPEYQFSLFDLDLEANLTTEFDADAERRKTDLSWQYSLVGDTLPTLDRFSEDPSFLFGVGYESVAAMLNASTPASLTDIDRFLGMTPAQQLEVLENTVDMLTEADFLTLQLYQNNDLGNPLLELLGVPIVVADVAPITLERRYHKELFPQDEEGNSEAGQVGADPESDGEPGGGAFEDVWREIKLGLTRKAKVTVKLLAVQRDDQGNVTSRPEVGILAEEITGDGLERGTQTLILDYGLIERVAKHHMEEESLDEALISVAKDPNFLIKITATSTMTTHDLYVAGSLATRRDSRRLGEVVVHDVLIQDGSLSLQREDFALKGVGPQLSFVRTYSNLDNDTGDQVLGVGWSHTLDKRLIPLSTALQDGEAIPSWVDEARGVDTAGDREPLKIKLIAAKSFKAPSSTRWTAVSANGTTFRLDPNAGTNQGEDAWFADVGRQGTLRVESGAACKPTADVAIPDPDPEHPEADDCFIFKAKDGTEYIYTYPPLPGSIPPRTQRTSLSLADGTVYRLYDAGVDAGDAGDAGGTADGVRDGGPSGPELLEIPEDARETPRPEVARYGRLLAISDRNDHTLTLQYGHPKSNRLLTRATDASGRSVCYHYEEKAFERPDRVGGPTKKRQSLEHRLTAVVGPHAPGSSDVACQGAAPPPGLLDDAKEGATVVRFDYEPRGPLASAQRSTRRELYTYAVEKGVGGGELNLTETQYTNSSGGDPDPSLPHFVYDYYVKGEAGLSLNDPSSNLRYYYNDMRAGDVVKSVAYPIAGDDTDPGADMPPLPVPAAAPKAIFTYDNRTPFQTRIVTDLRDQTIETKYELDPHGNPLHIIGPGDAYTAMEWQLKEQNLELCAKHVRMSAGTGGERWISTYYAAYDENGNVEQEIGPVAHTALNPARVKSAPQGGSSNDDEECDPGPFLIHPKIERTWNEFSQLRTLIDRNDPARVDVEDAGEVWTYDPRGNLLTHTDDGILVERSEPFTTGDSPLLAGLPKRACGAAVADAFEGEGDEACTEFAYDDYGVLRSATDAHGGVTTTEHDIRGRLRSSVDPAGNGNDAGGNPIPAGEATTRYEYDALDNLVSVTRPAPRDPPISSDWASGYAPHISPKQCSAYDFRGNKIAESDRNGQVLEYEYTSRNQVKKIERFSQGTISDTECSGGGTPTGTKYFAYDANGNLLGETDWKRQWTTYHYDDLNHRDETRNRLGFVMTEKTDLLGNVTEVVDFAGVATETRYDAWSRPRYIAVHPQADSEVVVRQRFLTYYDEADPETNLREITAWVDGDVAADDAPKTTFDRRSRFVHTRKDADDKTFTWNYDARGNLVRTENEAHEVVRLQYDRRNLLRGQINVEAGGTREIKTEFDYDANGNRTKERTWRLSTGEPSLTESQYDGWNRLRVVWSPPVEGLSRAPVLYSYDGEGNVVAVRDRRGKTEVTERDTRGLPTRITDRKGTVTRFLDGGQPAYDENGNLRRMEVDRPDLGGPVVTLTSYDAEDRPEVVTEAAFSDLARTTRFMERDGVGNVRVRQNPRGMYERTSYNALHLPALVCDPEADDPGAAEDCEYKAALTYTASGKLKKEVDRNGHETHRYYDRFERPIAVRDPMAGADYGTDDGPAHGPALTYYDAVGRVTKAVDRRGNVTENVYDGFGRLKHVYRYAASNLSPNLPPDSEDSDFEELPDLTRSSEATHIAEYDHDDHGNVTVEIDAKRKETRHGYDDRNQRRSTELPSTSGDGTDVAGESGAAVIRSRYDQNGNLDQLTDERGRVTNYAYDANDRRESAEYRPVENGDYTEVTTYGYDAAGNLTRTTRPLGRGDKVQRYDALNRLTSVSDERGVTTRYFYDAHDNLTKVCQPRSNSGPPSNANDCDDELESEVNYEYDPATPAGARDLLTAQSQSAGGGVQRRTRFDEYDHEGNLLRVIDPLGRETMFGYDELNRRKRADYCTRTGGPGACTAPVSGDAYETEAIDWVYDGEDNLVRVVESKIGRSDGNLYDTTIRHYDEFDRLDDQCFVRGPSASSDCTGGVTVDYDYDDNGNRILVALGTRSTTYEYDARNRLKHADIDGSSTQRVSYRYFRDGRIGFVGYPNQTQIEYADSYANNLHTETVTSTRTSGGGEPIVAAYEYQFDRRGNRTRQRERLLLDTGLSEEITTYDYDNADQLERFTVDGGGTSRRTEYTFEGYNRRTETISIGGTVSQRRRYKYNALNQLDWVRDYPLSETEPTDETTNISREVAYGYDDNGNTRTRTDSGAPDNSLVFDYDARNQLVRSYRAAGPIQGIYDYDADGMRVRHELSDRGDIEYFHDDRAVLEERPLGSPTTLAHYRYSDRLIRLDQPGAGGDAAVQYYHHDGLGSTVALTNADGALQKSYRVDPWGNVTTESGSSTNRRVFTGHEHDANTKLIYAGARYYDPATGRFLTQDSYLGETGTPPSLHRYLYAYGNPTMYTDPTGYLPGYAGFSRFLDELGDFGKELAGDSKLGAAAAGALVGGTADAIHFVAGTVNFAGNLVATSAIGLTGQWDTKFAENIRSELGDTAAAVGGAAKAVVTGEAGTNIGYNIAGIQQGRVEDIYAATRTITGLAIPAPPIAAAAKLGKAGAGLEAAASTTAKASTLTAKAERAAKVTVEAVDANKTAARKLAPSVSGHDLGISDRMATGQSFGARGPVFQPKPFDEFGGAGPRGPPNNRLFPNLSDAEIDQAFQNARIDVPDSPHYSVWFEAKMEKGVHYPGKGDTVHFREANRQLREVMDADPHFAAALENAHPGITGFLEPGPLGGMPDRTPAEFGLTWHHVAQKEGALELVPRAHHRAPGRVQETLHPDQKGGMEIWGGKPRKRRPR